MMLRLHLACGVAMLALATPASAQITAQDSVTAAGAEAETRGDIVVMGEKANRTLQDTPASVAVTTAETIGTQNLISVYDILDRTPNISVDGPRTSFSIRGIDAFNVSGGGDGALASVYLDGAVLPRTALTVGPLDLYDIAQVEVFRGPQSTVQGRNALAGAVIIRTADPSYDWTGKARLLMMDKDGRRRFGAAVGGPIVNGQIAFRLAGEIARSDGLIFNRALAQDADPRGSETFRGKLLLTPEAIPGLRIVSTYMHDRHERGVVNFEFDAPFDRKDRITVQDIADSTTVRSDIATLEAGYDLAPGFSLSSVTNYSRIRSLAVYDSDRSATPGQVGSVVDPDKTFQQELRLNIDESWVQGLAGAYFLRDDNRDYFFQARQTLGLRRLGVDRALLALGLPQTTVDGVLALYGAGVPIANNLAQPRLTKNYAGFADLTFPITSRLRVRTGLRYDRETQARGATQNVVITAALPDPAALAIPAFAPIVTRINGLLAATAAGATSVEPVRTVKYQAWLPKVGITYDVAEDVSLSATAQRGYRAGGAGLNQQRAQYYTFDPEYTWNYEVAFRSEWFDRALTVNANAYYIDWSDQQVSVQLTPGAVFDTQVINVGKSRLYGAELELSARPTRRLNFYAGAGYSHTEFLDPDTSQGALFRFVPGNEFANAPRWTFSGGGTWQHPDGLFVNVNANHRGAFYQDTQNQATRDIRARTLVNAKLGWQGELFGAFLIATNIFDVQRPTNSFVDFDGRRRGNLTEPRMLGLSFEGRF